MHCTGTLTLHGEQYEVDSFYRVIIRGGKSASRAVMPICIRPSLDTDPSR